MSKKQSEAKMGERNPRAKITSEIVQRIRKMNENNLKYGWKSAVARKYNISPGTVDDILNYRSWKSELDADSQTGDRPMAITARAGPTRKDGWWGSALKILGKNEEIKKKRR